MRSFLTVVNLNNLIFIFLRFSVITLRKTAVNYKKTQNQLSLKNLRLPHNSYKKYYIFFNIKLFPLKD